MAAGIVHVAISCIMFFTIVRASTPPKSVNLAVETSFLFEPHDIRQNTTMLKSVRQFIDNLVNLLSPDEKEPFFKAQNNSNEHENNDNTKHNRFTNFLTELGTMVIDCDENEVRSLAVALDNEVAINYEKNPKFRDLFKDVTINTFIKNTLHAWTIESPLKLQVEIARYITGNVRNPFVSFFQYINRFFEDDKAKLKKLLYKFAKARKTRQFTKPIAKTFDMIYDRYEKLDDNSKTQLNNELTTLIKHVLIQFMDRTVSNDGRSVMAKYFSGSVMEDFKNFADSIESNADLRINEDLELSVHADNNNSV